MRALILSFVVSWAVFAGPALASIIENGTYINASEGGRGVSIEQQGGQLTTIIYAYTSSGDPDWFYASGGYSLNVAGYPSFSGAIYRYAGGQCLGCSYAYPTGTAVGTLSVDFSDSQNASLTLGAGAAFGGGSTTVTVSRFRFSDQANPLLGQWAVSYSIGVTPTYANTFGEFIWFTSVGAPSGQVGATGVVRSTPSGYFGECFNAGVIAGQCVVLYSSPTSTYAAALTFLMPVSEIRGNYMVLGIGSNTRFRMQGVKIAGPSESVLYGVGTGFDNSGDDEHPARASLAQRSKHARAASSQAKSAVADAGPAATAITEAIASLRELAENTHR